MEYFLKTPTPLLKCSNSLSGLKIRRLKEAKQWSWMVSGAGQGMEEKRVRDTKK
jgi:hypothetical protein